MGHDEKNYDKEGSTRDKFDDFNKTCESSKGLGCFFLVLLIISHLRVLKKRANEGDFEAANRLLLPAYWWLIVGFAFTFLIEGSYTWLWSVEGDGVHCHTGWPLGCTIQSLVAGIELGCRRAIIDGVAIFLMHPGAGQKSVRNTIYILIPWCAFASWTEFLWRMRPVNGEKDSGTHETSDMTHLTFWTAHNTSANYKTISLVFELIFCGCLIIFYAALAIVPAVHLYRRPSLGARFIWWQLITMLLVVVEIIGIVAVGFTDGYCIHWFTFTGLQVIAGPIILLGTLRDDSMYWQGLLFLNDDPTTSSSHRSNMVSREYSQSLAQSQSRASDVLSRPSQGSSYSALPTNNSRTISTPSRLPSQGFLSDIFTNLTSPRAAPVARSVHGRPPSPTQPTPASPSVILTQPLLGQTLLTEAAQELANTMELLSSAPHCDFLHFGLLSIETSLEFDHPSAYVLGAGGAAKVYRGRLRGEPVAIKMIWSVDITADIVAAFREEVMMLAKLAQHPSIVQVKGFSVMPPALCVVMELCSKGSLLDILMDFRDAAAKATERRNRIVEESLRAESQESTVRDHSGDLLEDGLVLRTSMSGTDSEEDVLAKSWEERLQMACECAEALAFMHVQVPPVMHKDIKSANYLVVENRNVGQYSHHSTTTDEYGRQKRSRRFEIRLGDLGSAVESLVELSADHSSIRGSSFDQQPRRPSIHRSGSGQTLIAGKRRRNSENKIDLRGSITEEKSASVRSASDRAPSDASSSTNIGDYDESFIYRLNDGVTPNWAAPEVLEAILSVIPKKHGSRSSDSNHDTRSSADNPLFTDPYTTAADVYSLGVVLWEIATCKTPFEDASFMDLVHRIGRKHETPKLSPLMPSKFRALLTACWRPNPGDRPSAMKVVETLRKIQEDLEKTSEDNQTKLRFSDQEATRSISETQQMEEEGPTPKTDTRILRSSYA